jgi:quinol monooxygenase YgiN
MTTAENDINLIATFRAKEGKADQVRDLIAGYAQIVREEPGNIFFEIYTSGTDNSAFVIVERYVDQAAFDAHLSAEVGQHLNLELGALIEGSGSELQFLTRHV